MGSVIKLCSQLHHWQTEAHFQVIFSVKFTIPKLLPGLLLEISTFLLSWFVPVVEANDDEHPLLACELGSVRVGVDTKPDHLSCPVPVLASFQQRGDSKRLPQPLRLQLLHQHGLVTAAHPDEAAVEAQVRPLPEAEAWAKLVQPAPVELARGESGGGPQSRLVVRPGPATHTSSSSTSSLHL